MPRTDLANIPGIRMEELSSDPSTPASGFAIIYAKSDGFYVRLSTGSIIGPFGSGAATALNDLSDVVSVSPTAGDFLVYNGSNWVELPVGIDGQVLLADSGETEGVSWNDPVFEAEDQDARILAYLGMMSGV